MLLLPSLSFHPVGWSRESTHQAGFLPPRPEEQALSTDNCRTQQGARALLPRERVRDGWSGRAVAEKDRGLRKGRRGRGSNSGSTPCCCVTSGKLPPLSGQLSLLGGLGKHSAHKVVHEDEVR